MRKLSILLGAASVLVLPVAAIADRPGGGHGQGKDQYEQHHGDSDRVDRDHSDARGASHRHGCPPGLAKKHNGCRAPGQAWRVGQRAPWSNDRFVSYGSLPSSYRDQYADNAGQRYYYAGSRVYAVDPTTQLIRSIINIRR